MQQYLPTELARNIGALLWQLLWYLTTNCVLDSVLISKEKGRKIEHFNI